MMSKKGLKSKKRFSSVVFNFTTLAQNSLKTAARLRGERRNFRVKKSGQEPKMIALQNQSEDS